VRFQAQPVVAIGAGDFPVVAQDHDVFGVVPLCGYGEVVAAGDRCRVCRVGIDDDDLVVRCLVIRVEPYVDSPLDQLRQHVLRKCGGLLTVGDYLHRDAALARRDQRAGYASLRE
jgi:hypothetical protein